MKFASLVLVLLTCLPASNALAREHGSRHCGLCSSCCTSPAHWSSRHDARDARLAITTRDGDATMILDDDVVAVQLSDRVMHRVEREFRDKQELAEDNPLARAIETAVFSGVRSLLDHSAECSIHDLRDVDYRDGELVFTSERGRHVFNHFEIHNDDLLASFSEHDAQDFVREFRRIKAQTR